jgi:hypothetical protein
MHLSFIDPSQQNGIRLVLEFRQILDPAAKENKGKESIRAVAILIASLWLRIHM